MLLGTPARTWGAGCCSSDLCGRPWTISSHSQLSEDSAVTHGVPGPARAATGTSAQVFKSAAVTAGRAGARRGLIPWKLMACGRVMMQQRKTRSKGWQKEGTTHTIPASHPIHYLPEEMEMRSYHTVRTGGLRWGRGEVFEDKEGGQNALSKLLLIFCSVSVFSILEWLQILC